MPVNPEQAQMLTTLALDCRPVGARRWDAAGVMANIRKVADRDLAGVILAVIQAAEDRNAQTPGVIPTAGPHWRAPDPMRVTQHARFDREAVCTTCSKSAHEKTDHVFESIAARRHATAEASRDVARIVADLRNHKGES